MRLKRRVLPDFEAASLVLFGLLAAGAALPARGQPATGPHKPATQAQPQGRPAAARTATVLQRLPPAPPER